MQKKPLGCFTLTGILAATLSLAIIFALVEIRGGLMFSPGALNAQAGSQELGGVHSHAEIAGRCSACHSQPWVRTTMSERCLACHTDLTSNPDDFHTIMLAQGQNTGCFECHTDHRGAEASLTTLNLDAFQHQSVGFSLQGHKVTAQGNAFTCNDCHASEIKSLDLKVCQDCHTQIDGAFMQVHIETFGEQCLACHDGVDRYGAMFDHELLAFKLSGKHASIACSACHENARSSQDLQNISQVCFDCHAEDDSHQGGFGTACETCHTPDAWEEATFDHSQASFQLTGKHTDVDCNACHINQVYRGTPQDCAACHADDDHHQGQFGQDCAACHTADSWQQASYDHSKTAFPLDGAHASVECGQCHLNGVFKGTPLLCEGCHQEPALHIGLFPTECISCHNVMAWSPAQFDQPHTFPIDHGETGPSACKTCHPDSLTTYTCYNCHEHNPTEIASKHREEGISDFADCMRCHPTGREEEGGD